MGGLKSEIVKGIRIIKPRTLKEAISLARMKDEQLVRQRRFTRPPQINRPQPNLPDPAGIKPAFLVKRLSWEEMQKRRTMGLSFNCNDKFTTCHKCRGPQLVLLEALVGTSSFKCKKVTDDITLRVNLKQSQSLRFRCMH